MGRKEGVRIVFPLWGAPQYPAYQDRLAPRCIPQTGLRLALHVPRLAALPMRNGPFRPWGLWISESLLWRGPTRSLYAWSSILSLLACGCRMPPLGIHA